MKKAFQLVSSLSRYDAVSNYTRSLDQILQENGYKTALYATHCDPKLNLKHLHSARTWKPSLTTSNDLLIHQYSVHDQTSELFLKAKGKKVFIYHNITPHEYFIGYNDEIAKICEKGRKKLSQFKNVPCTIALSEYSKKELIAHGFKEKNIHVIPFICERNAHQKADEKTIKLLKKNKSHHLLFVGKIAPHKKIEDIIKPFYLYQKHYHPQSQLHLIGVLGNDLYEAELRALTAKLNLQKNIHFHGRVSQEVLNAYYQHSDLFMMMSNHEGFCVPLFEAMHHKLPVLAHAAAAIPETLGEGGIQIEEKDPTLIAEAINAVLKNKKLQQKIVTTQTKELARFQKSHIAQKIKELL